MPVSVFAIFKIGIGPSSSHTMGPMSAAAAFLARLGEGPPEPGAGPPARIRCRLHGSLAFTGKGHATDRAVALGLLNFEPARVDPDEAEVALSALAQETELPQERRPSALADRAPGAIAFDPAADVVFDYGPPLPGHPNGLVLQAFDAAGRLFAEETYYSIGGGSVLTEAALAEERRGGGGAAAAPSGAAAAPFPFTSAAEMLRLAAASGRSIAEMARANEAALAPERDLDAGLDAIWAAMRACLERGLAQEGVLPGGLKMRRRAKAIAASLTAERGRNDAAPHVINDWIGAYAMAVNEENAAGGRVVTAPTNGAAGVVPAVIRYFLEHCPTPPRSERERLVRDFLLTAGAIGALIKTNASISGAEVGCQGEVGSAAAMAAAGLAAVLGATPEQIENAAEIALEHHLGMTCDPIAGLVQAPCIERNGLGAVKAVAAASLALRGDGAHLMPLDNCIEAMRQTGHDMNEKYKETSLGGLAVNLPEC
ncbi:MAG: L-serine ammonia-lyase [Pseudomonadota bacterium]